MALGAAIAGSDGPLLAGLLTTPLLYGASAQLAAVTLLEANAAVMSVVAAVAVVNSRGLFYSASLRRELRSQPRWFRLFGPYLLVDPLFAVVSNRAAGGRSPADIRAYYLAAGLTLWAGWQLVVTTAAAIGPVIPPWLHLEFATVSLLIGLWVPALKCRTAVVAAAGGLAIGFAASGLPAGSGLLLAALGGALFASLREAGRC
jgi:predicted branched-subunit amino acid permease